MTLKPPQGATPGIPTPVYISRERLPYITLDTGLFSGTNIDAALTQAQADLGASGGRIVVPHGALTIANPPAFNETRNIILEGTGGENSGAQAATRVTYTGTAARAIDARSSYGFGLRDIQLLYSSASFTGILIDLSHSIAQDAAMAGIRQCYLGGNGVSTAAACVSLDNAISLEIHDTNMAQAVLGVKGRNSSGSYSNAITLDNVKFHQMTTGAIQAAGQAWSVRGCTFEQLASGNAGAYVNNSIGAIGVTFEGCWFGDGNSSGTWIDYAGSGLRVVGCYVSTGAIGVSLSASSFGADISGNQFNGTTTQISLAGSNDGTHIAGNEFKAGTTGVSVGASTNGLTVVGNRFGTGMNPVVLSTGITNVLIAGNNMLPASTDVTYTGGGTMPSGSIVQARSGPVLHMLGLFQVAGAVSDASFPATPPNGTLALDTTNSKIYARIGGTWKSVAVA